MESTGQFWIPNIELQSGTNSYQCWWQTTTSSCEQGQVQLPNLLPVNSVWGTGFNLSTIWPPTPIINSPKYEWHPCLPSALSVKSSKKTTAKFQTKLVNSSWEPSLLVREQTMNKSGRSLFRLCKTVWPSSPLSWQMKTAEEKSWKSLQMG